MLNSRVIWFPLYFEGDWTHVQHQGTWWKQALTAGNRRSSGAALWASQHVGVTSRFSMSWTEAPDAVSFSKRLRPSWHRIAKMMRCLGVTEFRNQIFRQGRRLFSSNMFKTSPNIRLSERKNGKVGWTSWRLGVAKTSEMCFEHLWTPSITRYHPIVVARLGLPPCAGQAVGCLGGWWWHWLGSPKRGHSNGENDNHPGSIKSGVAYFRTNPSLTQRHPWLFSWKWKNIWLG